MDPLEYKALHESSMQNNNDTSALNVFLHIVVSYFTIVHTVQLLSVASTAHITGRFAMEFLLVVLPLLLMVTVLHQLVVNIAATLTLVTGISVVHQMKNKTHLTPFVQIPGRRPQFMSATRALIYLMTTVCIVAVDFRIFPRDWAKTETFVFGLMDVGVGLYVFSNEIVYKANPERRSN